MDISVNSPGSFDNSFAFLHKLKNNNVRAKLNAFGSEGVRALSAATPVESGETAHSWSYEIVKDRSGYTIVWENSHMVGNVPLAILLQYGHMTGTGGRVQGRDYINPTMRPLFDRIAADAWKVVNT